MPFILILLIVFLTEGHSSLQSRFVYKVGGVITLVEGQLVS